MGNHFHGTAKRRAAAREKIAKSALLGVAHAPDIHYTQGPRRWDGIRLHKRAYKRQYPNYADCSAYNTWNYWDGLLSEIRKGLGDIVNGLDWKAGWTGSMLSSANGKVIARGVAAARRVVLLKGDLVIYDGHVAIVVEPKRRLVVSHGSEAGPFLIRMDYRTDIVAVKRFIY